MHFSEIFPASSLGFPSHNDIAEDFLKKVDFRPFKTNMFYKVFGSKNCSMPPGFGSHMKMFT
jgi:hypothetical protein